MILERFIFNKVNIGSCSLLTSSRRLTSGNSPVDSWRLKSNYGWFLPVQTRWKDNDQYLHVNNAVYHAIFDSAINIYLIRKVGLDPQSPLTPRGFMVTNSCAFTAPAAYPNVYMAGLAVEGLGNSSVRYRLGLFPLTNPTESLPCDLVHGHCKGDPVLDKVDGLTVTTGCSTHVFVDPGTGKPTPIPDVWREGLRCLMLNDN